MNEGWIKLHRKFLESPLFTYSRESGILHLIGLWVYLLLNANYEEKKWYDGKEEVAIPAGSLVTSISNLANETRLTTQRVRTALKHYEKMEMITIKTTNRWTQIWIQNWSKYQGSSTDDNKQLTNKEQTTNKQITTTKEIKNIRNKEYINNNILADELQDSPKKVDPYQRKPENQQLPIHRVGYYLEDTLSTKIVNWGKQAKALKMMEQAGYTEEQIKYVINQMHKDEFYQDKGFDLMTVANVIDKYRARDLSKKGAYVQARN